MKIEKAIARVIEGHDLAEGQMIAVMDQIMSGEATPAQIASFLTAERMKGESVPEIVGAVRVMREKATRVEIEPGADGVLMDIVGTGGDGADTFNVSTATSFVVAAAGVPIAKHGNRAVSSSCGSADVLEALGVNISLRPEQLQELVAQIGIGFLFAPNLHRAMKYAIGPRRELGVRTLFNILGPMTNPAGANVQLIGVFARELTGIVAQVLLELGEKRTVVVWGEGNMDEMTITGSSHLAEAHDGRVRCYTIEPEDVGLNRADVTEISGGKNQEEAAEIVRSVLRGEAGPRLDMVLLNAGTALMAAGRAATIRDGVEQARGIVASGAAYQKLEELIATSQALGEK